MLIVWYRELLALLSLLCRHDLHTQLVWPWPFGASRACVFGWPWVAKHPDRSCSSYAHQAQLPERGSGQAVFGAALGIC